MTESTLLTLPGGASTAALVDLPDGAPRAACVLAHGAGAGMHHAFLAAVARGLAAQGIAVLRFNFPFMHQGSKRPDPPAVAQAALRAAVQSAARRWPQLPLVVAGKSWGGRMATQAQALEPLAGVRGLVLLGFPLHPAGKPGTTRADHLAQVALPMLFLQGTRDALADAALLRDVLAPLADRATVHWIDQADHAFHVPVRSGRTDAQVLDALVREAAGWILAR
jgi:predicted alpha/beta-hydrolase family hydrolase